MKIQVPFKSDKDNVRVLYVKGKGKGKSIPLQAWSCPERSRKLRCPDFMTTALEGGKAPAAFTPRKFSWYSFLLEVVVRSEG